MKARSRAGARESGNCIFKLPFGEEIGSDGINVSDRASVGQQDYKIGDTRQKFTGHERDSESGLDYAINRYQSSSLGRFNSADPYNIILEKEKGSDENEKRQIFVVYISQPQIWNKYSYSLNNPIKYSDPDGRRPITGAEQQNIEKFKQSGYNYSYEQVRLGVWTAEQAEQFRYAVDAASHVIENAILAVQEGKSDPANLRAALYAINKIGSPGFTEAESNYYQSNGITVTFGGAGLISNGTNKCNFFVAVAYAKGAGIGWRTDKNKSGFPVNETSWGYYYPPTANAFVENGATNFVSAASPSLGDIVSGRGVNGHSGHTGIVISGNVVVSANPDYGVRTGQFPSATDVNSGVSYLRYKP